MGNVNARVVNHYFHCIYDKTYTLTYGNDSHESIFFYIYITDLATIVNDQQAQFDELEEDIDGVHDSAEQGLTQLQKANGYAVDRNGVVNSFSENRYKVFIGFFAGSGLLTALVYLMNAFFL